MSEFHFLNKFLKYSNTLASLIVLEEVFDIDNDGTIKAMPKLFDKYNEMLESVGKEVTVESPIEAENRALKDRADFSESELAELRREMAELRDMFSKPKVEIKEEPKELAVTTFEPETATVKEDPKPKPRAKRKPTKK